MCEIKSQPCGRVCTIPEANGEVSVCNNKHHVCGVALLAEECIAHVCRRRRRRCRCRRGHTLLL